MNKKELKNALKPLIRECLTEIFAEMKLESIVENVVNKRVSIPTSPVHQPMRLPTVEAAPAPSPARLQTRQVIMERMGISDDEWKNMYSDIDHSNPILTGEQKSTPNEVSIDQLASLGLVKDFSKHLEVGRPAVASQENDTEWEQRRQEFQKRISSIKRA